VTARYLNKKEDIKQNKQNNRNNKKKSKMKTKILTLAIVTLSFTATSFAQTSYNPRVSATANATATIITPISIEKKVDLNFGNIVANSTGGTVTIATNNTPKYDKVAAPSIPGTISAASFEVKGFAGVTYSIALPKSINLTQDGGKATMTVDNFVSNPSGTGILSASGSQTVNVGATLNVAANQVAGNYKGSFTVSVNYN